MQNWIRITLVAGLAWATGSGLARSADAARPRPAARLTGAMLPSKGASLAPPFLLRQDPSGWQLVSPEGTPFFSLGICVLNRGAERHAFDPENPGYAAWQHYPTPLAWADQSLRRLKSWGFTTVGAWGDYGTLTESHEQTLWLTPVLHMGSTAGAPWWDMWDPAVTARMESVAREQILAVRDNPRLLGYYSDNELGWWNATLWKMTLEQPPASGQRQRLLRLLKETYRNDWASLTRDFDAEKAGSWRELHRGGMLFLKPGGHGVRTMRRFLALLADRYYQLVHDIIRKYDGRGLVLGDRYQSFFYPEVSLACARHSDAISSNLNAHWNDGSFLRCYLDTLYALTGKPVLVSEFYLSARENRSRNRNDAGLFPVVATQSERAVAARRTLQDLARLPYVVGADWFQYSDEPAHGRADGENFNFGLVDIHDQPYTELTSALGAANPAFRRSNTPPRLDARIGLPPAPPNPLLEFQPSLALKRWDRERGFIPPSSPNPLADLYACWEAGSLYLGLYALDFIEDAYYRDRWVPKGDRPLWTVRVSRPSAARPAPVGELRIRLGGGKEAICSDPTVRVEHLSGGNLSVRNLAALELTSAQLGVSPLREGEEIGLDVSLTSHGQAYSVQWQGRYRLAK